jgi:high-affinity iron transporter
MFATMMVTFREGVEAFLVVAVAMLYLRQTNRADLLGTVRAAVATALMLSVLLGVALARDGALQPLHEAWLALGAFALVLSCTVHMNRHGKQIASGIRQRLAAAGQHRGNGAKFAVFGFVLLMIGREGIEAAAVLASLAASTQLRNLFVGAAAGVSLAAALSLAWVRYGGRVNLARFFATSALFMTLFAVQLLIYALHEFTEAGAVPWLDNAYWHVLSEPFGPQGRYGAWLSYSLVAVPAGFLLVTAFQGRVSPPHFAVQPMSIAPPGASKESP